MMEQKSRPLPYHVSADVLSRPRRVSSWTRLTSSVSASSLPLCRLPSQPAAFTDTYWAKRPAAPRPSPLILDLTSLHTTAREQAPTEAERTHSRCGMAAKSTPRGYKRHVKMGGSREGALRVTNTLPRSCLQRSCLPERHSPWLMTTRATTAKQTGLTKRHQGGKSAILDEAGRACLSRGLVVEAMTTILRR